MANNAFENSTYENDDGDVKIDLGRRFRRRTTLSQFVPITYSWLDINVFAKPSTGCCGRSKTKVPDKQILKNVSGICRPGELLAIMGASGAGKTTLLNVLTGRGGELLTVSGDLHVNGEAIRPQQLTSRSAYVQQDDLFIGTLTVKEQLVFQARLRMDRHIPDAVRMERVQEVMQELGLVKCQNTLIGIEGRIKGISGGETKRLAFACEVLTNPPLMFCDEPTTGLDSFMAQTIVEAMQYMAQRGRTVITTIHQPSSEVFALFDRVLLMAEGRVAFLGLKNDAKDFFARSGRTCPINFNPADFFIATLAVHPEHEESSRTFISSVCDNYDAHEGQAVGERVRENMQRRQTTDDWRGDDTGDHSPYKASWLSQFSAVLTRSALQIIREPMQLRIKIVQTVMLSLLLGLIYLDQEYDQKGVKNLNSVMFLMLTNMSFQNVFGVVNVFCTEVEIFKREHDNGMYRSDVYFIAKNIAEIPLAVITPVLFVGVIYYMAGLNPGADNFFVCIGIIVLMANTAVSFGYFISCLSRNLEMALAISAPLIIPLMLFGGFFLNSASVPVYFVWLKYVSWFNYANEALNINQWKDYGEISCPPTNLTTCMFPNGTAVLDTLNYDPKHMGLDLGLLFTLIVGYRLAAYIFLFIKLYRKKDNR